MLFRLIATVIDSYPDELEELTEDLERPNHGFGHTLEVVDYALRLLSLTYPTLEGYQLWAYAKIIIPPAFLHDIARIIRGKEEHAKYGAELVGEMLVEASERFNEYSVDGLDLLAMQHTIRTHTSVKDPQPGDFRYSKEDKRLLELAGNAKAEMYMIAAQIVYDADLLTAGALDRIARAGEGKEIEEPFFVNIMNPRERALAIKMDKRDRQGTVREDTLM